MNYENQDGIVFDLEYWQEAQKNFEKGLAIGLEGKPVATEDGRKLIEGMRKMFERKIAEFEETVF
jgi:hypothetical protein